MRTTEHLISFVTITGWRHGHGKFGSYTGQESTIDHYNVVLSFVLYSLENHSLSCSENNSWHTKDMNQIRFFSITVWEKSTQIR